MKLISNRRRIVVTVALITKILRTIWTEILTVYNYKLLCALRNLTRPTKAT